MLIYPTPGHYGDMYLATKRRTVYSPRAFDDLYVPTMVYPRHRIDTSGEENEIRRNVNQELMYTSNVVDDTYDLAARSRNRDAQILRDATRAIVDTETYHSPKAAVASRRARSLAPESTVNVTQRTTRLSSVPPRSVVVHAHTPYVRRSGQVLVVSLPKSVPTTYASIDKGSTGKIATAGGVAPWREYYRRLPRKIFVDMPRGVMQKHMVISTLGRSFVLPYHRYQYVPHAPLPPPSYFTTPVEPKAPVTVRVLASPLPYKRKFARKAALVGNKVEVVLPSGHHRRPRSKYAASVIREMNLKRAHEAADQSLDTTPTETSHLHASSKPVYYESQARAHWDEFGEVVKPKNVLSWKYRLDARVSPDDLLYQPKTYTTIHSRLRDVHDKMDRHRQLMDRYLDANIKPHTEDFRNPNMFMHSGVSTKLYNEVTDTKSPVDEE